MSLSPAESITALLEQTKADPMLKPGRWFARNKKTGRTTRFLYQKEALEAELKRYAESHGLSMDDVEMVEAKSG